MIGANERVNIGYIGVGGQGQAHVRSMKGHKGESNLAQVAVCDVSKSRMDQAEGIIGEKVARYEDHRKLIEDKDIDAVCIATVDHWHTPCSVDAMNAGKDVYVEKPMTRYLTEAWEIQDTCKRTGRLVQVGFAGMLRSEVSQGCRNHSVRHDRASGHGNHLLHAQQSKGRMELHHPGLGHTQRHGLEAMDGLGGQEDPFQSQTTISAGESITPTVLDCWVTSFLTCCILTCWLLVVLNFLRAW